MTKNEELIYSTIFDSHIGSILIQRNEFGISKLQILPKKEKLSLRMHNDHLLKEAKNQIKAYLAKQLHAFDLPTCIRSTKFRQDTWTYMSKIPYGTTLSYGRIAKELNSSPRAIGQACALNPILIIVPCHRVIKTSGDLGGFSGGTGIKTKIWLLKHETFKDLPKIL